MTLRYWRVNDSDFAISGGARMIRRVRTEIADGVGLENLARGLVLDAIRKAAILTGTALSFGILLCSSGAEAQNCNPPAATLPGGLAGGLATYGPIGLASSVISAITTAN